MILRTSSNGCEKDLELNSASSLWASMEILPKDLITISRSLASLHAKINELIILISDVVILVNKSKTHGEWVESMLVKLLNSQQNISQATVKRNGKRRKYVNQEKHRRG